MTPTKVGTPTEVGSLVNRRGCYMRFKHDRQSDWDWLREWEPSVVRIMLPGVFSHPASVSVEKIQRIHATVPGALILLRVWDVDDHNGDRHREMAANPSGFARKQIHWWAEVFDRIKGVPRQQLMAGLNNEVNVDQYGRELYDYTYDAMGTAYGIDMRLGVGMFSVGTPGKPGESPYDMTFFSHWEQAILAGNHALVAHEYEQPEGMYAVWTDDQGRERHDFENLINRHIHWPMKVPTIIGEGQLDGLIYNRHPDPVYGNSGWQNFPALWTPTRYADEYVERCKVADPSVISLCDFIWDPADKKWESFSPAPAAAELLARKTACEIDVGASSDSDHDVYIPTVIMDGPQIEHGEEELDEPEPEPETIAQSGIFDPDVLQAILQVEAGGKPFGPDARPIIRFEAHIYRDRLEDDELFERHFKVAESKPWVHQQWMITAQGDLSPIHTGSQATEYRALKRALHLNEPVAYESIGMGIGQTMGFNHARLGYSSARAMFADYSWSEAAQIVGAINYILSDAELVEAVKCKDWRKIAWLYNGNAVDVYAGLLEAAYEERVT